jgi:polyhydroxyalkanoate depolymerase
MSQNNDINVPNSIILIGGPIDARKNQTKPGDFAEDKSLIWFDQTLITNVPSNYPGHRRRVYPGFLQLAGFISMNLQRHVDSHVDLFKHLINGDNEQKDIKDEFNGLSYAIELSKHITDIKWIKLKENHRSDIVGKILDHEYNK